MDNYPPLWTNADHSITFAQDTDDIINEVTTLLMDLWDGHQFRSGLVRNGLVVLIMGVPVAFRVFSDKRYKSGWVCTIEGTGHEWEEHSAANGSVLWNTDKKEDAIKELDWIVDNAAANGDLFGWSERWALEDYYEKAKKAGEI